MSQQGTSTPSGATAADPQPGHGMNQNSPKDQTGREAELQANPGTVGGNPPQIQTPSVPTNVGAPAAGATERTADQPPAEGLAESEEAQNQKATSRKSRAESGTP